MQQTSLHMDEFPNGRDKTGLCYDQLMKQRSNHIRNKGF